MTDTIQATTGAVDLPAPPDASAAAPLPPPVIAPPAPLAPPPPVAVEPPTPPQPPMATGPSAIFSADTAMVPAEHATPSLPSNTPAVSTAAQSLKPKSTFDVEEYLGATAAPKRASKPKSPSRWLFRLILLALLVAGGWYGSQHGPALYDEYVNGSEAAIVTEPTAPLAFPNVTPAPTPIRTAQFVLDGLPETPGATYTVTTDFETNVSQVDIVRASAPDLQILTYGSDAMIRRSDGDQWYLLDRGQFPLDGRLQRTDWVRRIDELLPAEIRDQAVIQSSTESTISGVPTRHLSITIDASLLEPTTPPSAPVGAEEAGPDDADAVAPLDPATDPAVADPAAPAPVAAPTTAIPLELWIDGTGLVRQVIGAPQLGANTITVVSISGEAWIPAYPAADAIAPLTASALVELGI